MSDTGAEKSASLVSLPQIQKRTASTHQSYSRSVQEAPYRALIGVVVDGRQPEKCSSTRRHRIRRQTGLTNRWRLPESLYGDLLGSSQALKSINMPFNQSLANFITNRYPTCNEGLNSCKEFARVRKSNWSLLVPNNIPVYKPNADSNRRNSSYNKVASKSKSQVFSSPNVNP